ncbi:uncharacterized protein LOC129591323 isoform X2 [Paramacrobiotus metropolitanus]|uniref:uncharacterized protein LOC129591323 isoform X2 n=1 Tax=Paramacrobiotus metropolitanus TaxID=2943436 RepID=UPI0024459F2A|nr:uncharacterized protein LOC129591323 isoform X2 [Paramacrobiotus metropolitanus]
MERRTRASSTLHAQNAAAPVLETVPASSQLPVEVIPEPTEISVKSDIILAEPVALVPKKSLKRPSTVKRHHLTDEARKAIIDKHMSEPLLSQQQIVEWLDRVHGILVDRTTVGRTIQKYAVKEERDPTGADVLEATLFEWYSARTKSAEVSVEPSADGDQNITIMAMSLSSFKEKAAELLLTGEFDVPTNFSLSDKWLQEFLKKYGLEVTAISQDSVTSEIAPDVSDKTDWPNDLLPYLAPVKRMEEIDVEDAGQVHEVHEEQGFVVPAATKIVAVPQTCRYSKKFGRGRGNNYLTDVTRKALLEKHEECPDWSQTQLADWLKDNFHVNVHRATIGRNIKKLAVNGVVRSDEEDMLPVSDCEDEEAPAKKRPKIWQDADGTNRVQYVEDALTEYYTSEKSNGKHVPEWKLWKKAIEVLAANGTETDRCLLTTEWKKGFWSRLSSAGNSSSSSVARKASFADYVSASPSGTPPSIADVHKSVNVIRFYVFSSKLDADSKRDLMADLDAIYLRLGEANNLVSS